MPQNPLALPTDAALLREFSERFRIAPQEKSVASLVEIARAFATLPYENLSKIIRFAETGNATMAKELPADIVIGHLRWGTGGTCFSLTATLLHLVRSLGFDAQPILADRPYGPDTHCALLVMIEGQPFLLDPGYLLVQPVPIGAGQETIVNTSFNSVSLIPKSGGNQLTLATRETTGWKERLTFKTSPVDSGEFLKAWDASFSWDMMHYPVLTRVVDDHQIYQRGSFEQTRSGLDVARREIPQDQLVEEITKQFGISPQIVRRALQLLKQRAK